LDVAFRNVVLGADAFWSASEWVLHGAEKLRAEDTDEYAYNQQYRTLQEFHDYVVVSLI
jgi:hypothetical protein